MQSFIDQPSHGSLGCSLTSDQLHELKVELEGLLDEERERLHRNEERFRALAADSSVDGIERDAARRAADNAYASIQETNRALEGLETGTYGSCTGCDRSIPFERLQALPKTRMCVACQES